MNTDSAPAPEAIDLLIVGTQVVTMNEARDIIRDGGVALCTGADHRR